MAAEQRATVARLATEMAHEIQNPLNFVNNFAGLNSELIAELEKLLESGQEHECREVLKDLSNNSERIVANGRRVSAIVKTLQDQVNEGSLEEAS